MSDFMKHSSVAVLEKLSKQPFSLKKMTAKRINEFKSENCGLKLLYSFEKVDSEVMLSLFELAKESGCLAKMHDMQSGKIMNYIDGENSENRRVLHTAMRDFFENRMQDDAAKHASELAYIEIEKLKAFIDKIDRLDKFTDVIQIGIGGSVLGPIAMYEALKPYGKNKRKAHFISNIDPDEIEKLLEEIDLSKTLVILVSKSGTTIETLTNEELLKDKYLKLGLDPKNHFVAVTERNSAMDDADKYLDLFYIWDYVCGRFSPTSMVGGVVLSFTLGFDVYWELLDGANKMDKIALIDNIDNNLPLIGALLSIWNRNFLKYQNVGVISYSSGLSKFSFLLQQYEMESNGKAITQKGEKTHFHTCPIIWGDIGTNAQHSFFQYLHQGTDICPLVFVGFEKSQYSNNMNIKGTTSQQKLLSNLFAQCIALGIGKDDDNPNKKFEGERPSSILLAEKLTPFSLGAIMVYFEHKTAFEGFLWGINSFDQEGVQLGKKVATQMMDIFSGKEIDFPLGKAFIDELGVV